MPISSLRIGNEDFLVTSMIERCPKSMMLRELVKNALESAATTIAGGHRVEIAPVLVEGARKLSIWNTGPGMDADELRRMCDIASSIGKPNALDENFGMGAKVASLPSNPHGIRYRSCKAGSVHQVVMGRRESRYGRILQTDPQGELTDILDVTQDALAVGRTNGFDWTEVVLLGASAAQDTVDDPYGGNPCMPAEWIAEELLARFYSLPEGIDLVLRDVFKGVGGDHPFTPAGKRLGAYARHESVETKDHAIVHYIYDPEDSDIQGGLAPAGCVLQSARNSAGLIYRGEIYDRRPNPAWLHEAPLFGIPFGARNISIYIQLPDDFPTIPDGYRQFLRHRDNLQHHLQTREFAELARRHRPDWLLALLRDFTPGAGHADVLQGEMDALLKSLGVLRSWRSPGDVQPTSSPDAASSEATGVAYEVSPHIVALRDETDVRDRGMEKTAARFYRETHQVFVNTTYPGFLAFRAWLEQSYAASEDLDHVRSVAMTIAEKTLMRQICRKLVFGLAKRGQWNNAEIDQATSMYSLTLAVDDNGGFLEAARDEMARALASEGAPTVTGDSPAVRSRYEAAMDDLLAIRCQQLKQLSANAVRLRPGLQPPFGTSAPG